MKESLEREILQTIRVNDQEITWVENGREAWIGNRMFDVKKTIIQNHEYVLVGLFDDQETSLVKKISEEQQKQNLSGYDLLAQLFQVFRSQGKQEILDLAFIPVLNRHYPDYISTPVSREKRVASPPPEG